MSPARARKAWFASWAPGNTVATSGSSVTTRPPLAYREAYLFGRERLKSYSGRTSSLATRPVGTFLVFAFLIFSSLTARCFPRTDQMNYPSRSVNITTSRRRLSDSPSSTKRSSPSECRGSSAIRPSGSPNTVDASSNVTLCLARLTAAFGPCHSNLGGSVKIVNSGLLDAHNVGAQRPACEQHEQPVRWGALLDRIARLAHGWSHLAYGAGLLTGGRPSSAFTRRSTSSRGAPSW